MKYIRINAKVSKFTLLFINIFSLDFSIKYFIFLHPKKYYYNFYKNTSSFLFFFVIFYNTSKSIFIV